jgi:hypothetical protein
MHGGGRRGALLLFFSPRPQDLPFPVRNVEPLARAGSPTPGMTTRPKSAFILACPRPASATPQRSMRVRHLFAPIFAVALAVTAWLRWETSWSLSILVLATLLLALFALRPSRLRARPGHPHQHRAHRRCRHRLAPPGAGLPRDLRPGRLLLSLRRRDPLQRRPNPARTTYWSRFRQPPIPIASSASTEPHHPPPALRSFRNPRASTFCVLHSSFCHRSSATGPPSHAHPRPQRPLPRLRRRPP